MEITDFIPTLKLLRFDEFCKMVEKSAMEYLAELHNETFNNLERKEMQGIPRSIKKNMYSQAMKTNLILVKQKKTKALNIYFTDQILDK